MERRTIRDSSSRLSRISLRSTGLLCAPGGPGGRGSTPGFEAFFFFDFLAFFAFFAFFAFLAIVSSQSLMDGNATRGMLGGGPASQHPRTQSQQIRRHVPHTVTSLSLRYPQLLCIFGAFSCLRCALRCKKSREPPIIAPPRQG